MDSIDAKAMAAQKLTEGATLEELRDAARDLRALAPESALADLMEAKIERVLRSVSHFRPRGSRTPLPPNCVV